MTPFLYLPIIESLFDLHPGVKFTGSLDIRLRNWNEPLLQSLPNALD